MDGNGSQALHMRTSDPGGLWPARSLRLREPHRVEVTDLAEAVSAALSVRAAPDANRIIDYGSARDTLDSLWSETVAALRPCGDIPPAMVGVATLLDLLRAIKRVDDDIVDEQMRHRDRSFHVVRDGLAALREARTTAALVELAPAIVCGLGFDRAIVSRIADSTWIPEKVHDSRDPKWAAELLSVGRAQPQVLDSALVETEMVRRKLPILVHHVQERPTVHRFLAEASRSRSYVAAPLVLHGKVTGFLHADCYYQQRTLDASDRQMLAMFADGMSQALAATIVLDRVAEVRAALDRMSQAVAVSHDIGWRASGEDPHQATSGKVDVVAHACIPDPLLTRREVEVLRHMAAGDTNGRIARRLVISEGTVKSHVKHILRKLGAANRAEAVSQWLRNGPEPRSG